MLGVGVVKCDCLHVCGSIYICVLNGFGKVLLLF